VEIQILADPESKNTEFYVKNQVKLFPKLKVPMETITRNNLPGKVL
jgi:hypothetical protein